MLFVDSHSILPTLAVDWLWTERSHSAPEAGHRNGQPWLERIAGSARGAVSVRLLGAEA